MLPFHHFSSRVHKLTIHRQPLFIVSLMLFFWTLFDGSVSYLSPLAIKQAGFSDTMLGLIIGSSSITGATFDFALSKFLKNTHFRRVYLVMFGLCFLFPLILLEAKTIWLFLLAMAVWGLYFDLVNFGTFDFVGRKIEAEEHAQSFGIVNVFKSLGYLLAPLLAGLALGASSLVDWRPIGLMTIFLLISFCFYLLLASTTKQKKELIGNSFFPKIHVLSEISLWKQIGKILLPVLLLSLFFNIFDSFFWTIGPLVAENYKNLHPFNGLFLTAYELPALMVGWFVGNVTKKYGKKRTAFLGFLIGSLLISIFSLLHNLFFILIDVFVASLFVGFTIPALEGAYADYISETGKVEKEITALTDFFTNIGYIIGPIAAGLLADHVGNAQAFSLLGITCALVALILLKITPRKITVKIILPPAKS